jgi:hypothetical protein
MAVLAPGPQVLIEVIVGCVALRRVKEPNITFPEWSDEEKTC